MKTLRKSKNTGDRKRKISPTDNSCKNENESKYITSGTETGPGN